MCRWRVLVILIVLCKYLSTQPIAVENNDRPIRQLDFGECCPCGDNNDEESQSGDRSEDVDNAGSESVFSRSRDIDDCPCRYQDFDSQGASSLLLPNALRSAGTFLRPGTKIENLKPIFNPEVDLASSVLETLREVTDKEYEDALARDAAKTATEAVDDFLFGDATPQESANIVTIFVKPQFDEGDEDDIPEISHVQKSRCVQPIDSLRSNGNMRRVLSKSSPVLHKARLSPNRPNMLHKNFYDIDNGVGASNVHEQIVPININEEDISNMPSESRINTDMRIFSLENNSDELCYVNKESDFGSAQINNKLPDLSKPSLFQTMRHKVNSLNLMPKKKLDSWVTEHSENKNADLDPEGSDYGEAEEKVPNFRNKYQGVNFKDKSGPLSFTNLLNLRDVELIPLKELISKRFKKPKPALPSFSNHNKIQMMPQNYAAEGNSDLNFQVSSLGNAQSTSKDKYYFGSNSNEEASECKSIINDPEHDITASTTNNLDVLLINKDNMHIIDDHGIGEVKNYADDTVGETSNYLGNIERPESVFENNDQTLENVDSTADVLLNQNEQFMNSMNNFKTTDKTNLLNPISLDKTISTIRHSIDKKIEGLKNIRANSKSRKLNDKNVYNGNFVNDVSILSNINEVKNNRYEESIQVDTPNPDELTNALNKMTTTFKTDVLNDNFADMVTTLRTDLPSDGIGNTNVYSAAVSLQELEKLSNSLLQQELDSKCVSQNEPNEEINLPTSEYINRDTSLLSANNFNDIPVDDIVKPSEVNNLDRRNDEEDTYLDDLAISTNSDPCLADASVEPTDITMKVEPKENDISLQPAKHEQLNFSSKPVLNIDNILNIQTSKSLPIFDDIKVKLANLFDRNDKESDDDGNLANFWQQEHEPVKNNVEPEKVGKFQTIITEEYNSKINSILPNIAQSNQSDASIDNTKTSINVLPKDDDIIDSQLVLEPRLRFSEKSLSDINNAVNTDEYKILPTIDDIKVKLAKLFDKHSDNANMLNLGATDEIKIETALDCTENVDNFDEENNVVNDNKKDSEELKTSQSDALDAEVGASNININALSNNGIHASLPKQVSFYKHSLPELNNELLNKPLSKLFPTLDEVRDKVTSFMAKNIKEANRRDSENHDDNEATNLISNMNLNQIKANIDESKCSLDSVEPKTLQEYPIDTDIASNVVNLDSLSNHGDSTANLELQPILQPRLNFLKETGSSLDEALSISPLGTLPVHGDVKSELLDFFDKNDGNIVNFNSLETLKSKGTSNTLDVLNPAMTSDASTFSLQSQSPTLEFLDNQNLKKWHLYGIPGMRNVPKYKSDSQEFTRTKSQSVVAQNDGLLSTTCTEEKKPSPTNGILNFRNNQNTPSILDNIVDLNYDLDDKREQFSDLPVQATKHIQSTTRNLKVPVDAKYRQATDFKSFRALKEPINPAESILGSISRNHDDFNDKLRTLHSDFNDRIESVRNEILDRSKLLTSRARLNKPQFVSSNNLRNEKNTTQRLKYTSPLSSGRLPVKSFTSQKPDSLKSLKRISLTNTEPKKFKMPTAVSLPIPKYIQVPELRETSTKLSPFSLSRAQKTLRKNAEVLQTRESSESSTGKLQKSNTFLRNKAKPEKNAKVSFSGTPTTSMRYENKLRNSSPPLREFNELSPLKLSTKQDSYKESPLTIQHGKIHGRRPWPRTPENSFLSKVKDAVQSRLSAKSPITIKESRLQDDVWNRRTNTGFSTDMARAASDNRDIKDESLKENISYKCKMVCTKE